MYKKLIIIPILIILVIAGLSLYQGDKNDNKIVFHITLADSHLYKDGIYSNSFTADKGEYFFKFVPNGDSPQFLNILLEGKNFTFSENFNLKGNLHQTEISEYYTWDYEGKKIFFISTLQKISIVINPNGNVLGPVSVDIIKN